jgi:hypothetical protein
MFKTKKWYNWSIAFICSVVLAITIYEAISYIRAGDLMAALLSVLIGFGVAVAYTIFFLYLKSVLTNRR